MTTLERVQVSQLLYRLEQTLSTLSPASVVYRLESVILAVSEPPPGDPVRLRELAAAHRAAARDLGPVADGLRDLAGTGLPDAWRSPAGTRAAGAARATADLLEHAPPAFCGVAAALEEHADAVERLQARHGRLHEALYEAWYDASRVGLFALTLRLIDPSAVLALVRRAAGLVLGCRAIYRESLSAADRLDARLAAARSGARTEAARRAGRTPAEAVLIAGATTGSGAPVLPVYQLERAAARRAELSPADRATLDGVLAGAADPVEEAFLLKALAAGHTVAEIVLFAARIAGRGRDWLRTHLGLVDPGRAGPVAFKGAPVRQYDGYTCGSTSVLLARAMADPIYAFKLTTGGKPDDPRETGGDAFDRRLTAEEQRIHDETNLVWPQRLGTTPWGVADQLTEEGVGGYEWRPVDDGDSRSVDPALSAAVAAVAAGQSVPVLLGDVAPTHYVLLVGQDGGDLLVYEPTGGSVVRVPEADFRSGQLHGLGPTHVQAVIAPRA